MKYDRVSTSLVITYSHPLWSLILVSSFVTTIGFMRVKAHCDFRRWRRLYLDVRVSYCYKSKGLFILFFCLSKICSRCLVWWSLPSTNFSTSNAFSFSKTQRKLTFLLSSWPVAYFNYIATMFAVWVGANKLRICFLFWGYSIKCHTILAHFWGPISANPSILGLESWYSFCWVHVSIKTSNHRVPGLR